MAKPTVAAAVAALKRLARPVYRDGMTRFAIPNATAFGVPVGDIRTLAKKLGRDHALAAGLWMTGLYEPRMLACFVADPANVTPAEMDAWCRDFDNWAICDTACFHLFDKTKHAWKKVVAWAGRKGEFQKRAAFALLASLALHDKKAADGPFLKGLVLIERESKDGRNFVKKAVNWGLRGVGTRNRTLHTAAVELAERLSVRTDAPSRWIGKDALRKLNGPATAKRLAKPR